MPIKYISPFHLSKLHILILDRTYIPLNIVRHKLTESHVVGSGRVGILLKQF